MHRKLSSLPLSFAFLFIIAWPAYGGGVEPEDGKVRIRLRTGQRTGTVILNPVEGRFAVRIYPGSESEIEKETSVVITLYNNRLACKIEGQKALLADSVSVHPLTAQSSFTLTEPMKSDNHYIYQGSLRIFNDLDGVLLINQPGTDSYIAGVVRAEGGPGRHPEFIKAQALIARTYLYRYAGRHLDDGYDLCDATHCQVYHGITGDSLIVSGVKQTAGKVITTPDSTLIISAFHSNCGGETAPSEFVWLTSLPYLTRITDPHCLSSRNAAWERKVALEEWTAALQTSGYAGPLNPPSLFSFSQPSRVTDYAAGSFRMPLNLIRNALGLRSSWFSVSVSGNDSLLLRGRGYGHGVGLCQEGAMSMSAKGFNNEEIIRFYYPGVIILKAEQAKRPPEVKK